MPSTSRLLGLVEVGLKCDQEIERRYEIVPSVVCSMCCLFGIIYCFFGKWPWAKLLLNEMYLKGSNATNGITETMWFLTKLDTAFALLLNVFRIWCQSHMLRAGKGVWTEQMRSSKIITCFLDICRTTVVLAWKMPSLSTENPSVYSFLCKFYVSLNPSAILNTSRVLFSWQSM